MKRVGCFLWAMMRNCSLFKHRSAGTFVDFSLQFEFKHEDWYRATWKRRNDILKQQQELFCIRDLVVSSSLWCVPETAKKPFFFKIHSKRCFFVTLQLEFARPATSRQRVVALALTHYVNLIGLFQASIGNLPLISFKSSPLSPSRTRKSATTLN